jgi:solute carrier family 25 iron transporter 28/37
MSEALRIIRERDGWKGLRRGMGPRVMTVAPSTAISWLSYEFFSESRLSLFLLSYKIGADTHPEVLIRQNGIMPETGQAV